MRAAHIQALTAVTAFPNFDSFARHAVPSPFRTTTTRLSTSPRMFRTVALRAASVQLRPQYGPFIAGKVVDGHGNVFEVENPATHRPLCKVVSPSTQEVKETIDRAETAFQSGIWSKASALQRSQVLTKLARLLETRILEFAEIETLQTGRAIREMKVQLGRLPEWLDYYAALLRTQHAGYVAPTQGKLLNYVTRVPLGVVAQVTPFNHPMLISIKKIAPALAAGNSVVVKPSELAPISVLEFAELASEAGVPPYVLSILPGGAEVGKEIVSHPSVRKVDITAGTKTGKAIGSVVGGNLASFTAELGGKAPIIVFDDADVASAIIGVAFASFVASGQTCVSGTRLLLHSKIYDAFLEGLVVKVKSITDRIGDPLNPKSTMGPVISAAALERTSRMVSASPRTVAVGGFRMFADSPLDGFKISEGYFYAPTVVVDVEPADELFQEEVFGPVVTVTRFETESEAVSLANNSKYGLGAGIWTSNLSRAHRIASEIDAGLCWVNTHHRNDPSSPWGGLKESGIGRENGVEAYESYSQSKSTIVNVANLEETREQDDWFAETDAERRYG